jgi:capsular exopolysaccharide synthesis family protein
VVDSDLRRPTLHRLFKLSNTRGLTTALLEGLAFAEVAQRSAIPNLSVLTSGPLPPNPAELVGSHRMRECLHAATESFDLVLCDSPPLMAVGDAAALAAQCDGVIFVIRVGKMAHDVLRRVVDQLDAVKGRILGVVLNRADPRRDGYYYYYQAYQRYYGTNEGGGGR